MKHLISEQALHWICTDHPIIERKNPNTNYILWIVSGPEMQWIYTSLGNTKVFIDDVTVYIKQWIDTFFLEIF